jgi:phage/plasmid-like protein (TIGR03299 family)
MSANINETNGKFAMFSAKEKPWHGLGQVVDSKLTSEEAIIEAGLDYKVGKGRLWVGYPKELRDELGKGREFDSLFATYRQDTGEPFGVVGSKYEVVQNKDAFKFFDDIVGYKEAIFETAGALGKGELIFITAKLPSHIRVAGDDIIDRYLLFTNSHDGSKSIEVLFTPVRVVCNNTLQLALRTAKSKYKVRHTKSVHNKLNEARHILQIENTLSEEAQEIYRNMTRIRLSDRQAHGFINSLFLTQAELELLEEGRDYKDVLSTRKKNIIGDVQKYLRLGPGQDMETTKGTLWGTYNAVTGYFNNAKNYTNDNNRMQSIMFGAAANTSNEAFVKAVNILKNPNLVEVYN